MKRLLSLAFAAALWSCSPAGAVDPSTVVGDAAYTILNTDVRLTTRTAFTAGRTWTLPFAAGSCIGQNCQPPAYQLEIMDTAGAFGQLVPLTIARQTGDTINGNAANIIVSSAGSRILLFPTSANNWKTQIFGDLVSTGACPGTGGTATVTITIAAPGVITDTAHGLTGACPVVFTTSSALPTGITSGTTYWISPSSITTNTYSISTTVANALAGTLITTSGSQAGTQTRTGGSTLTSTTAADVTGLTLSQGDWDCRSTLSRNLASNTSVTVLKASNSQTSATSGTQGTNAVTWLQTAANVMGVLGYDSKIGPDRQSVAANTNLFLVGQDTFSVGANVAYGTLTCRRMS